MRTSETPGSARFGNRSAFLGTRSIQECGRAASSSNIQSHSHLAAGKCIMEWSKEKTLEFIETYKANTVLWDCTEPLYKDRFKRHEVLEIMAEKHGTLVTEVERKIKNLQSHFLREHKRLVTKKNSSSSWYAYKPLSFLLTRNKVESRTRLRPLNLFNTNTVTTKDEDAIPPLQNITPIIQNPQSISETTAIHTTDISQVTESQSTIRELFKWFKERDEFDLYGEKVAIKLRKISSPIARVTVQNQMNMLLMQAELGMFDSDSVCANSGSEFGPVIKFEVDESET